MEIDTDIHSQISGRAQEVVQKSEGEDWESQRGEDTTRRPTESTNLGSWGLTHHGVLTRKQAGAGPTPYSFATNVQLGLPVCSLPSGKGAVSVSVLCQWIPFPELPGFPLVREDVPMLAETGCPRVGWYHSEGTLRWEEGKRTGEGEGFVRAGQRRKEGKVWSGFKTN